jgi:hypothetical protein
MRKILFVLGLLCGSALAQGGGQVIVGNFGIQYVSSAPSGSCSGSSPFTQTSPAGGIYTCQNGTWASAGGGGGTGTVTSVGFTGGLISVATPTTTPALTVAGTSGGIPYFSSASTWVSSGVLTQYGVVLGGGAGTAPFTSANYGTDGNGLLTLGTQNATEGGSLTLSGSSTGGGSITLKGDGTSPGSSVISANAAGTTLNLGSTNATVTTAGVLTVASCGGCGGAPAITILSKTATYALASGDFSNGCTEWIEFSLSAISQTATLPSTAPTAGTCVVIKSITAPYYVQLLTGGSTTLDGVAFASSPGFPVGAGASITIASDGTNYHTMNGQAVPQVLAANKGGFYSITEVSQPTASNQALSSTSNQVVVQQFVTRGMYKISTVTFFLSVGLAAAVCDVGLYDSSGNKLFDISGGAGQACTTAQNSSQLKNNVSTALIIPPGTYFAAGCVSATAPLTVTLGVIPLASNNTQLQEFASAGTYGTAANPCVAGVLPSTLGTVTNSSTLNGVPYFWMQP